MATFNKFNSFALNLSNKVYNLGSDQLKVALVASAPVATNFKLTDLTEISYTNCSTRNITTTSNTQTSGVVSLILADLILTATGTVGPFRYIVIYDNAATNNELIGWLDYGSSKTLNNLETFTIDFDNVNGFLQIT